MIRLRPWLRVFTHAGHRHVEALLTERAVPCDDVTLEVLRVLAEGPVPSSKELHEGLEARGVSAARPEIHASLSLLSGIGLIDTRHESDHRSWLFDEVARGQPPLPVVDQLELTNHCPMSCIMCPTGTGTMSRPTGFMAADLFRKIVDEVAAGGQQLKPLTLHNLGESLLHKELPELVAYATAKGLRTEVSGNPGHLRPALYQQLQAAGLTRLVLDIDGLDQETLESIRGKGARGDRAFDWLDEVFAWRRVTKAHEPNLVLQMIGQPRNEDQLDAFLERYGQTGLPGVEAYVKQLDKNTRTGEDGLYHIEKKPRGQLCRAPWKTVVILWDGTVVPCCHDANGAVPLGNVAERSLADIWNDEPVRALRERLRTGDLDAGEPCTTCAHRPDRYELPELQKLPEEPLAW